MAQALRLGQEALGHLVEGGFPLACGKLREALSLHPGLGGVQAYRLLKALAQAGEGPMECRVPEELKDLGAIVADLDFATVTTFLVGCRCALQ